MFSDPVASKFGCARTKTTQILNKAMMPQIRDYTTGLMKDGPYSLVNDGTSDTSLKKMNATCVLLFDINNSKEVLKNDFNPFLLYFYFPNGSDS